ncbi:hypothetical protein EON65_07960 [archaeon]|nr:MAG: hypothetical protein EON65_07960 [archaeon]
MAATANHIAADQATMQSDLNAIFFLHKDILTIATPSNSTALQDAIDGISRKVSEFDQAYHMSKQESANLRSSLSAKEALIAQCNTQKTSLQAKEQESSQLVQEMRTLLPVLNDLRGGSILNSANFDHLPMDISPGDLLEAAKQTEEEAKELLTISKSGKVYLRRIKKLRQQNPNACPCCGQGMDETVKAGFDTRVQTLFALGDEQQFGTIEQNKEVTDAVHAINDRLQKIYTRYIPLQNVGQDNMSLDMNLAELLRDELSLQTQLQAVEQQVKDFEGSFNKYSMLYRALRDLVTRWRGVEQREEELQGRRRRQSQSLLGDMSNMSLDKLEALQRKRVEKKDQLQQEKEKLATEEAVLVKRSYHLKCSLSDASQAFTRAQLDNKRAEEIDSQITKLHERHQELDVEMKVLMNDRARFSKEIADAQMQVSKVSICTIGPFT